jgi:DNA-binding NarL/FixJ family response regulator
LVVDDKELIRRGIVAIIAEEPEFSVCGFAGDERATVKLLDTHGPDLLLLDLSLADRDGLQFLKDIAHRFPGTRIIALSDYQDNFYVARAVHAGAAACLTKNVSAARLIETLKAVAVGETPAKSQLNRSASLRGIVQNPLIADLTDRELHVFRLIGRGLRTSRVAEELGLSRKTIEGYRENIKRKLGYANAEELLKGALRAARQFEPE